MKNLNEQMLRIVAIHTGFNIGQEECEDTVSGIKSLIKDNYVEKEFVKWLYMRDKKVIAINELYDYWLENIKDK